jgi:predicted TIM-barrel fold metal-dependent hydrolase
VSIFDEPKIDCHNHVFDPARFEFSPKAAYFPAGAELGTRSQLTALFDAYGVQRALIIQPNFGYDNDNRCLIDVLARGRAGSGAWHLSTTPCPAASWNGCARCG